MRRKFAALALVGAVAIAGIGATVLGSNSTQAAGSVSTTFIVPSNDGYGIGDCALSGSSCGKVVADAWCEAQGFSRSESFGVADPADMTASIGSPVSRPISITCGG